MSDKWFCRESVCHDKLKSFECAGPSVTEDFCMSLFKYNGKVKLRVRGFNQTNWSD